jgi:hypothetical protein
MGWDRVRYFNGVDGESTLISADKRAADTVYGEKFKFFARHLGFAVREVVDVSLVEESAGLQHRINKGHTGVVPFPDPARRKWIGTDRQIAEIAVELRPPVDEAGMRVLNAYLITHCEPNDAGYIIDNRRDPETLLAGF